jgi:thiamine-phosphate pyrophosphorylase
MICLVTDRRRLAGGDAPFDAARRCLAEQARFAADAGVDLIQVREPDLEAGPLAEVVTAIAHAIRGSRTRLLVNDRLDVALACGADGVHLRSDSIAVADVRRLAPPGFVVGRSVHSVDEAAAAGEVDYLIAGTVFPTASKPEATVWLGTGGLAAIVRAVRLPVLAIGGVTPERFDEVAAAGATGFAAIGLFLDAGAGGSARGCRAFPPGTVVTRARSSFDSTQRRS